MTDEAVDEVENKPNLVRPLLVSAQQAADEAVDAVSPAGLNPLHSPLEAITAGAWVSPDADTAVTDLTGMGTAVKSAFTGAQAQLDGFTEPATVEVPGPQAWKASAARVHGQQGPV